MKMIDFSMRRFLFLLLCSILSCFILYKVYQFISPSDYNSVKTYKVSDGWGYQIIIKEKVLIDQPFIPGLPGIKAFPDKKSAAKTGKIVLERLLNHQSPTITKEDIKEIGLDSSGNIK
jgi:hypothetical protein